MDSFPEGDALRASFARALGGLRSTPATDDAGWLEDWQLLVDLGLTSVLDPDDGAGELGVALAVVVAEELAAALHPLPAHAVLPASLLRPLLETEIPGGYDDARVAFVNGGEHVHVDGATIKGETGAVCGLVGMSHLVLAAGPGLNDVFLVDTDAPGVRIQDANSLDLTRTWATLVLDGVEATRLEVGGSELARLSRVLLVADAAATTTHAVRRTVEYARTRETFGTPIGRYQAVQHRLVEHMIAVEQMTDLVAAAVGALAAGSDDGDRRLLVAEVFCSERSQQVLSDCIQLTGGIGFTWEHGLHFALRRCFGDAQLSGGARRARVGLATASDW